LLGKNCYLSAKCDDLLLPAQSGCRPVLRLVCAALSQALIRCGFRAYVHDPAAIDRWLTDAGFDRVFEDRTFVWLTRVYARRGA
jgi:hypothetical protein